MTKALPHTNPDNGGGRVFGRYAEFLYTSDEAKRLLRYLLEDNKQLVDNEPRDSKAYAFLKSLGVIDGEDGAPVSLRSNAMTFDEKGNLVADVALKRSFAVSKPELRSGTLMHSFNSASMRGSDVSPEAQKNADYLSDISDAVRKKAQYFNLQKLLDDVCPDWQSFGSRTQDLNLKLGVSKL
jgi:hypothetical protein